MPSEPRLLDVSPAEAAGWLSSYWSPIPATWPYADGKGLQRVKYYAAEMRAERWLITPHDPIKLTNGNELIDGRARLLAVVRCGSTVEMAVAGGYYYDDWFLCNGGQMYLPGGS